jgi:tripartite-type tricarboxylate transporter receptor subunit TctC
MSASEMTRLPFFACAASLLAAANFVLAQEVYPSKPIRLVVPFPAGGAVDIVARDLGQRLTEAWRQQVVIDDRGGANGRTRAVNRAPLAGCERPRVG